MAESYTTTINSVKLNLTFPTKRVNEPVLADVIKKFGVSVDIRRAQVEENVGGYIMLEMTGTDEGIDESVAYMKAMGVGVGFIGQEDVGSY